MQSKASYRRQLMSLDARKSKGKGRKRRNKRAIAPRGRMQVYGDAYRQVKSDIASIYRVLNVEDKHVDAVASAQIPASAWTGVLLNAMTQGTNAGQRIGQSVKSVGIELRFTANVNTASPNPQYVRVVLFLDKQPNGANPTFTNVYAQATDPIVTPRVDGYEDQFIVYYDKVLALGPTTGGNNCAVESFIAPLNFHTIFNSGNAGTIADIQTNALWLMWTTDVTANMGYFSYGARYIYVDN